MFGQGASAMVGQPTRWHASRHRLTALVAGPLVACAGDHLAGRANAARQPWPNRVNPHRRLCRFRPPAEVGGWCGPLWRLSYDLLWPNPGSGRALGHGVHVGAFRRAEPVARAADALDQHAAALVHRQLLAQTEDELIHAAVLWLPGAPQRGLGQRVA